MNEKHDPADLERPLTQKEFDHQPADLGETSSERQEFMDPAIGQVGEQQPENQVGSHRTVLLDFDATLYSYTSGWQGEDVLPDPPEKGAIRFVTFLMEHQFNPVVFSSRARTPAGKQAIEAWLVANQFPLGLQVTCEKLPAVLIVDDRGFRYRGNFGEIERWISKNLSRLPSGSRG
jgi:hypothetical protein